MQISNIDKLYISFNFESYDEAYKGFIEKVERRKQITLEMQANGSKNMCNIIIGNEYYYVYPHGNRSHAYILEGLFYKFYFSKGKSKSPHNYPIAVDISSNALWNKSPENSYKEILETLNWINNEFNEEPKELNLSERVDRVDLCCHTDQFSFDINMIDEFQGRFKKDTLIRNNKYSQTFQAGVGDSEVICRMYDKIAEINETKKKTWFFGIWEERGLDTNNVWNIEFQLRRDYLRETKIRTFSELYNNLKSLWFYCTQEWLVHKEVVNTRLTRCPVSKKWSIVQKAFDDYKDEKYISRKKQVELDAKNKVPCITGNITSYISMFKDLDYEGGIKHLIRECNRYLNDTKGSSMKLEIQNKRKKYWEVKQNDYS